MLLRPGEILVLDDYAGAFVQFLPQELLEEQLYNHVRMFYMSLSSTRASIMEDKSLVALFEADRVNRSADWTWRMWNGSVGFIIKQMCHYRTELWEKTGVEPVLFLAIRQFLSHKPYNDYLINNSSNKSIWAHCDPLIQYHRNVLLRHDWLYYSRFEWVLSDDALVWNPEDYVGVWSPSLEWRNTTSRPRSDFR